ncbi:hypothetical protein KZX45_11665 [Georgenia sp. EYE_87]|uniref:hypothetical protein n=1 Tax=Georgenia sp. EYE_87 TaxID=2853448 RepID=UPI002004EDF7|nr:hypothetical protein [Georgenia sp. EYE_87]MCK6211201.1 hypothetical protein [Georgenia sp. EYE_87]
MTQGPTPPTGSVGNPLGEPVPTTSGTTGYSDTSGTSSTKDAAKQEASHLAHTAGQDAQQVKETAKETAKETVAEAKGQARYAVAEAKYQARDLFDQTRREMTDQSSQQQHRLAGGLRSFSGELDSLASGTPQEGLAADLARQASSYADRVGRWLDEREPADVLDEVSRYARRHPGTFIAIAAGLGLLAGRVARSLKDESAEDTGTARGAYAPPSYPPVSTYPPAPAPDYGTEYQAGYGTPTTGTTGVAGGAYGAQPGTSATGAQGGVYGTEPGTYSTGETFGTGEQR